MVPPKATTILQALGKKIYIGTLIILQTPLNMAKIHVHNQERPEMWNGTVLARAR